MRIAAALSALVLIAGGAPAIAQSPSAAAAPSSVSLGQPFGDHGVLQRDKPISVWGQAAAGERVTVSLGDRSVQARADRQGQWRTSLPALPAGGPYLLTATAASGAAASARDIMVGDVFLCSGQSNMEQPLRYAVHAWNPVVTPDDAGIRLMTVTKDSDAVSQPLWRHPTAWSVATVESAAEFSATCFYFAQDLRRTERVPMGLVHDSWGGSAIQAWISEPTLRRIGGFDAKLDVLARYPTDPIGAQAQWGEVWQGWWAARSSEQPWLSETGQWTPVPKMTPWEQWGVPALAAFDGMVWYRTDVTLTAEQAAQGASLSLGTVDQVDQTWVNGRAVGAMGDGQRMYALPSGLLKAGANSIVVNVMDSWGEGGLYGPAETRAIVLADGSRVPLDAGGWRYQKVEGAGQTDGPRAPWESLAGTTSIGNAMISPLHDYGFRAALWYQGESNTGDQPPRYEALMAGLMADWRQRLNQPDLPFLIVQLANFGPPSSEARGSGWAEVREGQRLAVQNDPHAGLAVAIDIGDRYDIHPGQKGELGKRLARAGRHVIYGQDIVPSGAWAAGATRDGSDVVVRFTDVTDHLITLSSDRVVGLELCDAAQTNCRFASGTASGETIRVAAGDGPAAVVRFCWADNPICNLTDGSELPAGPFRLTVQ
ncbi:MAG: 9-O-acetylesterase [Brevundimonas sp.]|nr:MAG: 9-O-acetylesterase [Brevundimonas sp.]